MGLDDEAIEWLLESDEPAVRALTRRDVLGEPNVGPVSSGPKLEALLEFPIDAHPYRKWTGVHWRLVSLAELGADPTLGRVRELCEVEIEFIASAKYPNDEHTGLPRRHASIPGNALGALCRLGYRNDPRVVRIAEQLARWQWPDGGWNCDQRASGRRSSFHETLPAMWGLHEFGDAETATRSAELFLSHRLFKSGERVIKEQFLQPRYPPYWHYDILQALLVLSRMGLAHDPRTADARAEIARRRRPDGRWAASGYWWRSSGKGDDYLDVVDWGRGGANEMITLNALRVATAVSRLSTSSS